jgi:3-phenylpropionate/trans-cinnamate dioxygenase ferredoxin reductase subunit
MECTKYLIVGSGAAGSTASLWLRRHDSDARITVVGQETDPMYARTQLPALVRGVAGREEILLRHASHFASRGIEMLHGRAEALNTERHEITLTDGRRICYEKLLLAGGSKPRTWRVPGSALDGVVPLRTLADAEYLRDRVKRTKHVVVIGGGFISLNVIEALSHIGVATTLITRDGRYCSDVLDEESSLLIERKIQSIPNVRAMFGTAVEHIEGDATVEAVLLSDGRRMPADLIITNIGAEPDTEWLRSSGLALDSGVLVDTFLQSSDDAVWAAGDIAMFEDVMLGVRHRLGNWANATAQGEAAAYNMTSNQPKPFESISAYSITFMGLHVDFVGDYHVHSGMTAVPRGSGRSGHYARLMVHEDRLVGATLLNYFADKPAVERIIASRSKLRKADLLALTDETIPLRETANYLINKRT